MSTYLDESGEYSIFVQSRVSPNVSWSKMIRLVHLAFGLSTEVGEFIDPIKKMLTKGEDPNHLNFDNMDEEIGDLLFYIQEYANLRGKSILQFAAENQRKLEQRYPQGFTAEASDNRDYEKEQEAVKRGQAT